MMSLIGDTKDETTVEDLITMLSSVDMNSVPMDRRTTQVTEVIVVPTSEHVAQIVGKSGSKIKNLRARTGTCIKTPLRGDDPVFTVTGTADNVQVAAQAIRGASDHFSRLMKEKSVACAVGEVTVQVPVPAQYVGVVVGRNGSVIMKIKEQTNTRINTPKGDSPDPSFEVTGSRANVVAAKEAIEDKVRSAYQLKESTVFDPDLSHKSTYLRQLTLEPNQSPMKFSPTLEPLVSMSTHSDHKSPLNLSQSTRFFGLPSGEPSNPWPFPPSAALVDSFWSMDRTGNFPKYTL